MPKPVRRENQIVGSSCGSDASWINVPVRGDVVDLAARDADVVELHVAQVGQPGLEPPKLIPVAKGGAAIAEPYQAKPNRCEPLSRRGHIVGRSHLTSPRYYLH